MRVVDDECLNEGGARATTPAPAPAPAPGPGGLTGPEPEPAAHTRMGYLGIGYVQVRHSHIRHQPASQPAHPAYQAYLAYLPGQPSPDSRPGHDTIQHDTTRQNVNQGTWQLGSAEETRYVHQLGSGNPVQIYGPLRVREKNTKLLLQQQFKSPGLRV